MTDQDGFEEAVLLFDANGDGVVQELRHGDFEAMLEGSGGLDEFAASIVNAAFVVVGEALSVRGIVLFSFKVDEEGSLDPSFNLPLRYLSDSAGPGPDLGTGPIRLACRGRCPVPWHAVHLWEPANDGGMEAAQIVQKSIWRNRLSLKPTAKIERILGDGLELNDSLDNSPDNSSDDAPDQVRTNHRQLEARLTETFGEEGKVNLEGLIRQNNDRLTQVTDRYRSDLEQQQQGYLDQIKNCRDEIQTLKSALRNEQQHSRRLQSLLRGEP